MRRVCLIATASGNGKTTVGRQLARRLGVPFVELDALHHGPNWTEATLTRFGRASSQSSRPTRG